MSQSSLMLFLYVSIASILVVAFIFLVYTLALRFANIRKRQLWEHLEKKWEPLLAKVLAGAPDNTADMVSTHEALFFVDFLSRYALRFTGPELEIVQRVATPWLPLMRERALGGDPEIVSRALITLGMFDPYDLDIFRASLDSNAPMVALSAVRVLCEKSREESDVTLIVDTLERIGVWGTEFSATTISHMNLVAAKPLRERLSDNQGSLWSRILAAETLRIIPDYQAAQTACDVIASAPDVNITSACLRLLGEIGSGQHADLVRRLIATDDIGIKVNAVRTLGKLGGFSECAVIRKQLTSDNQWVVLAACEALFRLKDYAFLKELSANDNSASLAATQILATVQQ